MDIKSISDEDLVKRIEEIGHPRVHSELYNRYAQKIFFKCVSMVKDEHVANDLTHDIFIMIFTKLNSYKGKSDHSFWKNKISINHILIHFRVKKRRKLFDSNQEIEGVEVPENIQESLDRILTEIRLDTLELALRELPEAARILLIMKYMNGMKVKDISETLKIGESAIKMRLARLRKRLLKIIELKLKDHG